MSLATRPLGRTGLSVTPIGIGTARLAFVPMEQALETCRAILVGPLTHIDTAARYGNGDTERRLGTAIARFGLPLGALLATKAGRDPDTNSLSGDQVYRSVERSLRLLNADRLQLVYLHDPEYASEKFGQVCGPGGALSSLVRLKEERVVQAIGVAAGPIDLLMRYVETDVFDAVLTHNRYTLLSRIAEPLIRIAVQRGMAVVNAAPYASGILAKGAARYPRYVYREAPTGVLERVRCMEQACIRYGVRLAAAALQFSLRDARITSTLVGVSRPERIMETLELCTERIPDELWNTLDRLAIPDVDPQWPLEVEARE
jgi:D-threo-aldose 1-dehydrogenase